MLATLTALVVVGIGKQIDLFNYQDQATNLLNFVKSQQQSGWECEFCEKELPKHLLRTKEDKEKFEAKYQEWLRKERLKRVKELDEIRQDHDNDTNATL